MNLPNADRVHVAKEKITDYLLNPKHPDGAAKAAFFAALGFKLEAWEVLAGALREVAARNPIGKKTDTLHGTKYIIDGALKTPSGKTPVVRTVWIVDQGADTPRLVTAYPHDDGV
ncbi:MAG TPA: hypothetical protein VGZ47_09600 [Gemmataceae bacterium]|nr:hypothetical protein [Gemmataceae bacterium]